MIKVITWNVNSVAMRLGQVLELIDLEKPDFIFLQEIKCGVEKFPSEEFEKLGYRSFVNGQKAYNGVAILMKNNAHDAQMSKNGFADGFDHESRYAEVSIKIKNMDLSLVSIYVPNGQAVTSEKFPYKLSFLKELRKHIAEKTVIIGGDFNVAPYDIDVKNLEARRNSLGFHPLEQKEIRAFYDLGFYDPLRLVNQDEGIYSWWDYRSGGWHRNDGMRIDYFLISSNLTKYVKNVRYLKEFREKEKPSDHIPVVCELNFG